jgi:hypothetical protein
VIDEPRAPIPHEYVRIPQCAIRIHHESVEPDDECRCVHVDETQLIDPQVRRSAEETKSEIRSSTPREQIGKLVVFVG